MEEFYPTRYDTNLYHHGIQGMKWGVRRFQNDDGTLTAAGKSRYRDAFSGKATAQRALAGVYRLNAKAYDHGKSRQAKLLANMNRAAEKQMLKSADKIQAEANAKRDAKSAISQPFKNAKANVKQARKDYYKSFNDAYNHNYPFSLSKKRRQETDARWEKAYQDADRLIDAKADYKRAKTEYKKALSTLSEKKVSSVSSKTKDSGKQAGALSLKAMGYKAMADIYGLNEKAYAKSNPTLASMNAAAKDEFLAKAQAASKRN